MNKDINKEIEKTYSIEVICTNCNYGHIKSEWVEIPLGVKFSHWRLHNDCPVCGCRSLQKV